MLIRERTEQLERETLSPFAMLSANSEGRELPEAEDPIRTCYQRDRDRILHCKSFRRLKHKTQVFIDPSGDHYRTRLTHTLEVSQIARTIARALRTNEDLTEAIALGHDVGHTPFGHAGEEALDVILRSNGNAEGFKHYLQSVRVLSVLENEGNGLNLSRETVHGIAGHSKGRADIGQRPESTAGTVEAEIVRVADRIAYLNHDLDDAMRAGWFSRSDIPAEIFELGETQGKRIGRLVGDFVENSVLPSLGFSKKVEQTIDSMKEFLFENLYHDYSKKFPDIDKAKHVLRTLFTALIETPSLLPAGYTGVQGVVDYISGMTDRFAIREYENLFVPKSWDEPDGRIAST